MSNMPYFTKIQTPSTSVCVPDTSLTLCSVQLHWPTGLEQGMLHLGMFQVPSPAGEAAADCSLSPVTYHPRLLHMTQSGSYVRREKKKIIKSADKLIFTTECFEIRKQAPGLTT